MKIITSSQVLAVSGGCQKAVDKYQTSTGFYEFVGSVAGIAIAYVTPNLSAPVRVLAILGGHYVGSEVGYVFGAASYWVDRAIHRTTDGYLKPAL